MTAHGYEFYLRVFNSIFYIYIFPTFSEDYRAFLKTTEDFRGGTDDVSIIQQHI